MTTNTIKFENVNNLPGTLTPNTLSFVKTGDHVDLFVTDSAGANRYPVNDQSDIHPFFFLGVGNG